MIFFSRGCMPQIYRLIVITLTVFASWLPTSSFASFPATASTPPAGACTVAPCYKYSSGMTSGFFDTPAALGTAIVAASKVDPWPGWFYVSCSGVISYNSTSCVTDTGGNEGVSITKTSTAVWSPTYSCPPNGTVSGSICTCNANFVEGAGVCTSGLQVMLNVLNSGGAPLVFKGPVAITTCYEGIVVRGTGGAGRPDGTHSELYGPFTSDGSTCTPTPESTATVSDCPVGSVRGTVNGQSVCSPSGATNSIAAGPTESVTPSAGASAPTLGDGSPVGAVGSSTSTSCSGESCSTTKTYTDSSGAVIGSKTESGSKTSFCSENPSASICSGSTATDSALPGLPSLYTPKFPGGLSAVWSARKTELTSTPLFSLVDKLMPSIAASGTCPQWNIPLDLGPWNYGSHDVAPPCWVWDFAKAIVILSALLLARALIFGG